MSDTPSPWDRLPEETDHAYAAFVLYRNLGPGRSFTKAAKLYAKTATQQAKNAEDPSRSGSQWLQELSSRYGWVSRCRAYDDDWRARMDAQEAEGLEDEVRVAKARLKRARNLTWTRMVQFQAKLKEALDRQDGGDFEARNLKDLAVAWEKVQDQIPRLKEGLEIDSGRGRLDEDVASQVEELLVEGAIRVRKA
jgi:hypothetical protein